LNNETLLKTSLGKENLSIQQMVYAEDYLRKSLEKMQILPGKRIEVSGRLIAEAVEKARSLTEAQIDNLTILINSPENKLGKAARKLMESQDYSSQLNDFRQLFGAKPDGSKIVGLLIVDAVK
jgi:UDP-N-acetylglucosamine 2-epimerase